MPLMKIRSSDGSQWKTVNSLTFNNIELKEGIIEIGTSDLTIKKGNNTNTVATQSWVKGKYDNTISSIEDDIENLEEDISTIKEKSKGHTTHFEEIKSTDGVVNLNPNDKYNDYNLFDVAKLNITIGETKKIHAFMNFSGDNLVITYSNTDNSIIKGDDVSEAKNNEIWELDIYVYNKKQYIIWKNWSATK